MNESNPYTTPAARVKDQVEDPERPSTVKKLLMILGAIFASLLLIIAIAFAFLAYSGRGMDEGSKAYVDAVVAVIAANWDMAEMQSRLSPEFKATLKEGELEKLYAAFRRLGTLKKYYGSQGDSTVNLTPQGKLVTARYFGRAEFTTGPAEFQMTLIRHGEQWQIYGFRINSRVFLEPSK